MKRVALPTKLGGGPGAPLLDQVLAVDELHARVVRLRMKERATWVEISTETGYRPSYCRDLYYDWRKSYVGRFERARHRERLFMRYEEVLAVLRPYVVGDGPIDGPPPDRRVLNGYLKVLRREARMVGTDAPRRHRPISSQKSAPWTLTAGGHLEFADIGDVREAL